MSNNFIIAKEGFKSIILTFLISIVFSLFISDFLGNLGFLFTLMLLFIYKNPERDTKRDDSEILSIADGRIDTIDFHDKKTDIYINVSICNTHILRAPSDGSFKITKQINGLNLNPNSYKAQNLNSSVTLKFNKFKINLLSGICGSKIYIDNCEHKIKGDRIGLFLNGIIKITLKNTDNIKLNVKIGDKVRAGETVIAFIK